MEKQIRTKIANILKTVNADEYPNIHQAIQVDTGYKNIEAEMIKIAINDNMSLESTLYHIERQ